MTSYAIGFLVAYALLYIYVLVQTNFWLRKISKSIFLRVIADILLLLPGLMPLGGSFMQKGSIQTALEGNGNVWLGLLMFYGALLLFFHIIRGILWLFGHRKEKKEKHRKAPWLGIFVLGFCILVSLTLNVWGNVTAHNVTVQNYNIALDKKTTTSGTLRVALISDLHLGANSYEDQLRAMVKKLNKSKPDVVLIAGDIFNSSYRSIRNPESYAKILNGIQASQGVYAVYGNHDVEERLFGGFAISSPKKAIRSQEMENFMKDAGIQVLNDQTVYINGVQIVGRLDGLKSGDGSNKRESVASLTKSLDTKMPIVVLQHEGVEYRELGSAGVDLALNGHSHNGQIFPGNLLVSFMEDNSYGLKRIHGCYTVTTSGVGYYGPPIRLGTQSEIALINLSY